MSPDEQLVDILEVLVNRFGTARSLGEVYATSYALKAMREGSTLSIAEIAEATGCSKQNLSRWLQNQVDTGQAKTKPADDDARKLDVTLTDPMQSYRHLEALAGILKCNLDQPKTSQGGSSPPPTLRP